MIKGAVILVTKVIAHRGSKGTAPENTLISFREALEVGSDGIELDVHLSKDNFPVVIHDETIDRTTNGSGLVCDFTVEELQQFDAGGWFHNRFKGEKIPTLEEVLVFLTESNFSGVLNIELKTDKNEYKGIEMMVLELVASLKPQYPIIYSSFNYATLERLLEINPEAEYALLFNEKNRNFMTLNESIPVKGWHTGLKTLTSVLKMKNNIPLRVWTVNTTILLSYCFRKKVDSVITDFPKKALHVRRLVQGG
ncbi:glycerophosphodiester phosphodiesterase [Jeotgalibaca ciconiae]|uniref:glycerophosphodiester phosphodiesterase n=1 Tax=Jeotgalibaca ciconiae TaxID=2496265 RepID=UPI001D130B2F|nr:glycerophosphodiester phosphodiesterase [Jeotgalibaca ciconiae]